MILSPPTSPASMARARRSVRRFVVAAAVLAAAVEARAQAIFMSAPQPLSRIEIRKPDPVPAAPVSAPPQSAPPAAAEAPKGPATLIRHLTNNIQGYRLAGEIGASEWPIYLTEAQARRKLQFQLGYLSAVSVMPEASTLTLTVNDEVVGEAAIKAVPSVKTVVFDIPAGLMRPGFNSVRISTEQRHRVDCSIEATYELWTQIDPTQTGLILGEADARIDALADLGALLPDEQGALPIRAVISAKATGADVERMLRAVQLISIVGRFEQPVVDAGPLAGSRYGINLVVGTAAELARYVGLDVLGAIDRPRAIVLPATAERRTTIVISGASARQVDEAMKQFLVVSTPRGSPQGLRAAAAFPGFRIEGGQRVKLSELGLTSEEFTGRLFRAAFNIFMPTDFYAADYGRASVRLAGGYAAGLNSKAQIVMKVNDRTAVSLALLKSAGDVFKDNPLPIPLGFLRPGLNRIEIEAHAPTDEDANCDPLSSIRAKNRFLFLDSTEIEMPPIARVARMPDLAVTATGGFPFAGAARRPKLYLPSFEQKSIGAAATMVAHLAIAAGRPVDFEITLSAPGAGAGPTLAVAPLDALDPALLQKLDLPAKELREAWRSQIATPKKRADDDILTQVEAMARNRLVLQSNFPMACHPPRPTGGFKAALSRVDRDSSVATIARRPPAAEEAPTRDLFEEWDARLHAESRWTAAIGAWLSKAREWGLAKFTDANSWVRRGFEHEAESLLVTPRAQLAIGQNILGETSEDVWTVVTAPNADALAEAVDCLVDPRVSRQISGRVSVLDMSEAKVNVAPVADARFVVTQPLSVGNVRLIAAGWLSLHSAAYVCGALALAMALAVATRVFVRNVGRRTE